MTQEDKELLLKDLCARLSYGVKCRWVTEDTDLLGIIIDIVQIGYDINDYDVAAVEDIKPYLRPMSSMTEEEVTKACTITGADSFINDIVDFGEFLCEGSPVPIYSLFVLTDYLNSIHVDYRGLIEKGLALKAPDGMYGKI